MVGCQWLKLQRLFITHHRSTGSLLKYTLLLTDTNGCESKYNITVIPLETIKVWPNIIYPDGGGINSVFNVANEDNTLNAVFIYDRWGNALVSKKQFWKWRIIYLGWNSSQ